MCKFTYGEIGLEKDERNICGVSSNAAALIVGWNIEIVYKLRSSRIKVFGNDYLDSVIGENGKFDFDH